MIKRLRGEAGMTLVELMMAMTIMTIIMVPVTAGLLVGLRTTDETRTRLVGSDDAQTLAQWLPADIASTGSQSGDVVATPTSNTDCSGLSNALRLKWRETQGSTTNTYVAAYAIVQNGAGDYQLVRYFCTNSGTAATHVVARHLASSSAVSVSTSGTKISMTVSEANTPTETTNYTFTISGNRRSA